MRSNIKEFMKKYFMLMMALTFICTLFTMSALAAYTKSNKAKRVAATYDDVGARFSSNYMDEWIGSQVIDASRKALYVKANETASDRTISVTINNFARGVEGYTYDRAINYTLTAKPVYIDNGTVHDAAAANMGSKSISISMKNSSATFSNAGIPTFSVPSTLNRGGASTDTCIVTFSSEFMSEVQNNSTNTKIYLLIQAVPDGDTYTDLNKLACLLYFTMDQDVTSHYWTGNFSDPGSDTGAGSAIGFDGYNYYIEGVGSGTGYLKWNPDYLVLNEESMRELDASAVTQVDVVAEETINGVTTTETQQWNQISFALDSDNKGRYDIQFYQNADQVNRTIYETWGGITDKVRFEPELNL